MKNQSETHWKPTCLIGDQHARSETNMPDRRPTCLIGYRHAWLKTDTPDWIPRCLIGDPSWTDMPYWRPIGHDSVSEGSLIMHVGIQSGMSVLDQACLFPIRHVGLRSGISVSDQACWSMMGLQSDMSVSNGSPMVPSKTGSRVISWSRMLQLSPQYPPLNCL